MDAGSEDTNSSVSNTSVLSVLLTAGSGAQEGVMAVCKSFPAT